MENNANINFMFHLNSFTKIFNEFGTFEYPHYYSDMRVGDLIDFRDFFTDIDENTVVFEFANTFEYQIILRKWILKDGEDILQLFIQPFITND